MIQVSNPQLLEIWNISLENVNVGNGYRNQAISFGGEYRVILKHAATVVTQIDKAYPTIVALYDLLRKTEKKKAIEF